MTQEYTVLLVFDSFVLDRFVMARHVVRGWELPGGRVEAGEELLAAARREWDEECGLPLHRVEPLVLHERPDGSLGHVFLGAMAATPGARLDAPAGRDAKIAEVRLVRALADVTPMAFPDDPYAEVAGAVLRRLGSRWSLPAGESQDAFVGRLSFHAGARPHGHRVTVHPLSRSAA